MAINVEVSKNQNENNISLIKRFTRKVQETGVLKIAKSMRFTDRNPSPYKVKKAKLHKISKKTEMDKKAKMGELLGIKDKKNVRKRS